MGIIERIVIKILELQITPCSQISDIDGCQAAATIEGIIADAGHAFGDGDGGQAAATRESRTADAGHAAGDGDGG